MGDKSECSESECRERVPHMKPSDFLADFYDEHFPKQYGVWITLDAHDPVSYTHLDVYKRQPPPTMKEFREFIDRLIKRELKLSLIHI